jgi:hypothetical protein
MKMEVPDEYLPLVAAALDHYGAYLRATQRDDRRYQEAADWFKKKQPAPETRGPKLRSRRA